jgi:hypothetical protein
MLIHSLRSAIGTCARAYPNMVTESYSFRLSNTNTTEDSADIISVRDNVFFYFLILYEA